jgi:outer membrane protein
MNKIWRIMKIRNLYKLLLLSIAFFGPLSALAKESYYSDYPGEESDNMLLLKFKVSGIVARSKGSGLPSKSSANPPVAVSNPPYNLLANGFGAEGSATIFYNSHLASEISIGLNAYKVKQSVLNKIYGLYNNSLANPPSKLNVYSVPVTLTFQYHIAPYGGFSPYVGAGYSVSYFYTGCKALDIKKMSAGPVLQAGFDLYAQDNTIITFDVKKYFLKARFNYKASFLGFPNNTPFNLKINPLVLSVGIGFKY